MSVIVQLNGGLGNQMFQYALGRKLAIGNGLRVLFDLSYFELPPGEHTSRSFGLDAFSLTCERATQAEIKLSRHAGSTLRAALASVHPHLAPERVVQELGFAYDPAVLGVGDGRYVAGYWQSEKYFLDVADAIRKDFAFRTPPTRANAMFAEQIHSTTAVSMHVRRGDYINQPAASAAFEACGPDYYAEAIRVILQRSPGATFFVFSDDLVWAREHLQVLAPMTFVEGNTGAAAFEDMRLMSLCDHHIIANSSFSWWGAWLNARPDKLVIAPKRWFKDTRVDTRDLLPDNWIKL